MKRAATIRLLMPLPALLTAVVALATARWTLSGGGRPVARPAGLGR